MSRRPALDLGSGHGLGRGIQPRIGLRARCLVGLGFSPPLPLISHIFQGRMGKRRRGGTDALGSRELGPQAAICRGERLCILHGGGKSGDPRVGEARGEDKQVGRGRAGIPASGGADSAALGCPGLVAEVTDWGIAPGWGSASPSLPSHPDLSPQPGPPASPPGGTPSCLLSLLLSWAACSLALSCPESGTGGPRGSMGICGPRCGLGGHHLGQRHGHGQQVI